MSSSYSSLSDFVTDLIYDIFHQCYISDESGSDSDGADSTSSSYSSLSDFVTDLIYDIFH